MVKEVLTVRDVDENTWRRFRTKTQEEGMKTGQALNEALNFWIKEKEKKRTRPIPQRFLKMNGIIKPGRQVRWSIEVDKILYAGKDTE